jgi:hypothetical protein
MDRGSDPRDRGVGITDIYIPFWRVVAVVIKWWFASIVALIVVSLIVAVIGLAIGVIVYLLADNPGQFFDNWDTVRPRSRRLDR